MDPAPALSRKALYDAGKALRRRTPREAHADFSAKGQRDPLAWLKQEDAGRIAALLPLRYERMRESPFAFLRGAAGVMARDLVGAPQAGIAVQACGDAHIMNFAALATPEDNIVFDINDFDESLPGVDFTVDVKRLAASIAVAAFDAGHGKGRARQLAMTGVRAYRLAMAALALLSPLELWHNRIDLEDEIARIEARGLRRKLGRLVERARQRLAEDDQFPHLTDGKAPKILNRPPLIYHAQADAGLPDIAAILSRYQKGLSPDRQALLARYALADVALKVVGIGSVGTFCAIGLYVSGDGAPLFLQVKEARESVLAPLAQTERAETQHARRVVEGQRLMQAASDFFLGAAALGKRQFYVRQLKNRRLGAIADLVEEDELGEYGALCGRALARAHARSASPAMIAGYLGKSAVFDAALGDFALSYAAVSQEDHAALVATARKAG